MWSATARIRSASPTEVPPNFWTTSGIRTRLQTAHRPDRPRRWRSPAARCARGRAASGRVGDPRPRRGLGRVSGRAQRQESPPARWPRRPGWRPRLSGRSAASRSATASSSWSSPASSSGSSSWSRAATTTWPPSPRSARRPPPSPPTASDAKLQAQANAVAVKAGCPASTKTTGEHPEVRVRPGHDDRHLEDLHGHRQDRPRARSTSPWTPSRPPSPSTTSCSWPTRATTTA